MKLNLAFNASSLNAALSLAFVFIATACGQSADLNSFNASGADSAIIGGKAVVQGSTLHRSIVALYDVKRGALCTGSLLPNNIVLTAAHCVGPNPADHLVIFTTSLSAIEKDPILIRQLARPVSKTIVHEGYRKPTTEKSAWTSDMALVKFEGQMPEGFAPAEFAPIVTSEANDWMKPGVFAVVAGFGVMKDTLHEVSPKDDPKFTEKIKSGEYFCDIDEKTKEVRKCFREETSGSGALNTTELGMLGRRNANEIVLAQDKGTAACMGDSGGPAYLKAGDKFLLWGIASRVSRGCNGMAVYTDATAQMTRIQAKTAELLKSVPVKLAKH